MSILSVSNPKWSRGGSCIDLIIEHSIHGQIPFTASPDDVEQYGRKLFEFAARGDFGTITPEGEE